MFNLKWNQKYFVLINSANLDCETQLFVTYSSIVYTICQNMCEISKKKLKKFGEPLYGHKAYKLTNS
jgi:hypothetical protein